jgi:hypothetical protein
MSGNQKKHKEREDNKKDGWMDGLRRSMTNYGATEEAETCKQI